MADFRLETLILPFFIAIPGFVFVFTVSQLSFRNLRFTANVLLRFLFCLCASIILVKLLEKFLFPKLSHWLALFENAQFLSAIVDATLRGDPAKAPLSFLKEFLLIFVPLSFVSGISFSIFIESVRFLSTGNTDEAISKMRHLFAYVVNLIARFTKLHPKTSRFSSIPSVLKKLGFVKKLPFPFDFIERSFKVLALVLFVLLLLIIALFIAIGFLIHYVTAALQIVFEFIFWIIEKLFAIISHQWQDSFRPLQFSQRRGIPIVEILTHEGKINKGVFCSFSPAGADGFAAILIHNVIQYSRLTHKDVESPSFARGKRTIYEFPNPDSILTVPKENIRDFNISFLTLENFRWEFRIDTPEAIDNQMWYFRLILKKYKSKFSLRYFDPSIDLKLSPLFFMQLIQEIDEAYSSRIYNKHKRELVCKILKVWRAYRREIWKEQDLISNSNDSLIAGPIRVLKAQVSRIRKETQ